MSNSDSFISEVSEEVRKDRISRGLRKWGWLGIIFILIIVGGAATNEWYKVNKLKHAQSLGDKIIYALDNNEIQILKEIKVKNNAQNILIKNVIFSILIDQNNFDEAEKVLNEIKEISNSNPVYNELNLFKLALLNKKTGVLSLPDQFSSFEKLSEVGFSFRLLSMEQMALILIEQNKLEEAKRLLVQLVEDSETSGSLYRRSNQLLIALGGDLSDK